CLGAGAVDAPAAAGAAARPRQGGAARPGARPPAALARPRRISGGAVPLPRGPALRRTRAAADGRLPDRLPAPVGGLGPALPGPQPLVAGPRIVLAPPHQFVRPAVRSQPDDAGHVSRFVDP